MPEVKLFKRRVPYVDKEGKDRIATNFFLCCGDVMIPIEVTYFENKETGKDARYLERKTVLSAFAEPLPDKDNNGKPKQQDKLQKPVLTSVPDITDDQIPF